MIAEAESWLTRDTERCRQLLESAERALAGQQDVTRLARIGMVRGALALLCGDLEAAATFYRRARRSWLAAGRRLDAVRAAAGSSSVQLLLGEPEAAGAGVLRIQGELASDSHDDEGVAALDALVQMQLGDVDRSAGRTSSSLRRYDLAENLFAALGDVDGVADVQLRRGIADLEAELAHSAMLELNRARQHYREGGHEWQTEMSTVLIAAALSVAGQTSRALALLECVGPELQTTRWSAAFHALARAGALLRAGSLGEAHAEAHAAEEVFAHIGAVEYSARAALIGAQASLNVGRPHVAAAELVVVERLAGDVGNHLLRARTWLLQAEVAWAVGELDAVRTICERVVAAEDGDTPASVRVGARLTWARAEEPEAAERLLDEASNLAVRSGRPELRVDVLLAKARQQRRAHQITPALASLRHALRAGRASEARAGIVCQSLEEVADELIGLLLERGDHAGRLEALRRVRAAKRTTVAPKAYRQFERAGEAARSEHLERLIAESVRPVMLASSPDETLPSVPTDSLVEYYVRGEDVIVFVVRDGHVDAKVLTGAAPASRRLVSAWQQECRLMAPGPGGRIVSASPSSPALEGLFDLLLAPIVDLLADLDDELHVIGHRHLHGLPFDALLDEAAGPWYANLDSPLARTESTDGRTGQTELRTVVLAVPDEDAPSIAAEAAMIRHALPSAEVLLGADATGHALLRRACDADVVHFACHGVFRREDPLASALRLGDGWLRARDIAAGSLNLHGAIVVLSACNSGASSDYTPEPVGLVSACLEAGAAGVVAALWAVDDEVTLDLMTQFYRALASGRGPRSALRSARREVCRRYPHPYYWAAFSFIGAGADVE